MTWPADRGRLTCSGVGEEGSVLSVTGVHELPGVDLSPFLLQKADGSRWLGAESVDVEWVHARDDMRIGHFVRPGA